MNKKIYAINSKISPSLCFYLIANQQDFNIVKIIPNMYYDNIIIDVYEEELVALQKLLLIQPIGTNVINEISSVLNNNVECPLCKRYSYKPISITVTYEKDDPMYLEQVDACVDCCRNLDKRDIRNILESSIPTDDFYHSIEDKINFICKLYDTRKYKLNFKE